MNEEVLGLDLGTNSIGWAIVRKNKSQYELLHRGVDIFPEGVAREKGNEKPSVQERTQARSIRRHYFRRRLRKIELLKVLIEYRLCPELTIEQLLEWKLKKKYPLTEDFIKWQRTDDNEDKNPYHYRYECLSRRLNLEQESERYILGRALYHLCQRRGFLSNRKDGTKESDGEVKASITKLTEEIEHSGCKYIGEYYYWLYQRGEKIRGKYAARNEHYRKEFNAICDKQELPTELVLKLERAIFYQRPLKSQKGLVGKCTFEKTKSRCPLSHPRFEEFRMLSFINNIKVKTMYDNDYRPLDEFEKRSIIPLFMRKSKAQFEFEDIAKTIAGKKVNYGYKDDKSEVAYRFNYRMTTNVSGCPVTAGLIGVFGEDWLGEMCSVYQKGLNKTSEEILNDIWHVLFSFDDDQKLQEWCFKYLQLNDEQVERIVKIPMPQGYASLSLNAINKILVYLRRGLRYDEAVILANVKSVLPQNIVNNDSEFKQIESDIIDLITKDYVFDSEKPNRTKRDAVKEYLEDIADYKRLDKVYHPSMIETYPNASANKDGVVLLGSPRTSSVRNPMAMRALFRLRHLINQLIKEGKINQYTKVNIEFSRSLNDANQRKAIELVQLENNKKRNAAIKEIQRHFKAEHNIDYIPSEDEIIKYLLWEEQKHMCIYTGNKIDISEFVGANPKYDIEHTVPRSRGGDDSQLNKTLCESRFNREVKRAKLPSELSNYNEVMAHVAQQKWETKINDLEKQISRIKTSGASSKEIKDAMIVKRHRLRMELDYWRGKYERFTMKEVPQGFSNRQGVDIGIIGRYARMYLNSYFNKYKGDSSSLDDSNEVAINKQIFTVKGATTAEFRVMWGLQEEYTKKERVNHVHHCIDAIVIACIDRGQYQKWATYKRDSEIYRWDNRERPQFEKPWTTFVEDVKSISDSILISHYTADNMPRQTKKVLRVRGRIQRNAKGEKLYQQGDTARGSLHLQTFYGAIKKDEQVKYVIRKRLTDSQESDVKNIVDEVVREKIREVIAERGFNEAFAEPVWMNKEKGVEIKKVRIYAQSVKTPIHLKKQRDLSPKEYKRDYHVANDMNYCMAIYEGSDNRGKIKRSFRIVNNLEAAQRLRLNARKSDIDLVPLSDKNDYPLKWVLKIGTMVLFYENSPEEIKMYNTADLSKRLYRICGMWNDGRIQFQYHQVAKVLGLSDFSAGQWKQGENLRDGIRLGCNALNILVEGVDFELTTTGEIIFK